ncbi:sulfur-oxidizing protein SoxX [Anaerolineae bacterium]|nr:sulfur-oxidizing protein SoxX [Anaerolineae bacterium]
MKLRMVLFLAVLAVGLVLVACGGASNAPQPSGGGAKGDAAKGKTKFAGTCVACHGPEAKGVPGLGKDMTTSAFIKGQTDAQLLDFIKKGRPANDLANTTKVDMPPKGGNPALTDSDLNDIIAFIRSISK